MKVWLAFLTLIFSFTSNADAHTQQRYAIVWDIHDVLVYKDPVTMATIAGQIMVKFGPGMIVDFIQETARFLWRSQPGPLLKTIAGCIRLALSRGSSDQFKSVIASYDQHLWRDIVALLTAQKPDPRMVQLVQTLAQKGYSQWIASNIGPDEFEVLQHRHPELFSHLSLGKIIDEQRFPGVKKPHLRFFEQFVETTGLYPHEIIFIDDQPANVAVANTHAWRALKFEGYEQLITDLQTLNVIVDVSYDGSENKRETICEAT